MVNSGEAAAQNVEVVIQYERYPSTGAAEKHRTQIFFCLMAEGYGLNYSQNEVGLGRKYYFLPEIFFLPCSFMYTEYVEIRQVDLTT